ncbi:MAG: hypothetical protein GY864_01320 [Desulfobacterales bacterium]|nr:hypothetical protein [Desulfobacterales bacterium]
MNSRCSGLNSGASAVRLNPDYGYDIGGHYKDAGITELGKKTIKRQ